jgi:HSP20 family molecular chaperone IbpA
MANPTQELEKPEVNSTQDNVNSAQSTDIQTQGQGGTAAEQPTKQELQTPQGVERTRTGRAYTPVVDIYETNDSVVLVADMPGVDENSVDVTLEKGTLTIYGHVEPQVPAGYTLSYAEYGIGDFQRSFSISNEIDWEHIEGTVKDGVLRLTLPKAGPAQTKKIAIKPA